MLNTAGTSRQFAFLPTRHPQSVQKLDTKKAVLDRKNLFTSQISPAWFRLSRMVEIKALSSIADGFLVYRGCFLRGDTPLKARIGAYLTDSRLFFKQITPLRPRHQNLVYRGCLRQVIHNSAKSRLSRMFSRLSRMFPSSIADVFFVYRGCEISSIADVCAPQSSAIAGSQPA